MYKIALRTASMLLLALSFSALATDTRLAFSKHHGVEIKVADNWCQADSILNLHAEKASFFTSSDLETFMKKVGKAVLSSECPILEGATIAGYNHNGTRVYTGRMSKMLDWAVAAVDSESTLTASYSEGVDLDAPEHVIKAPAPSAKPTVSRANLYNNTTPPDLFGYWEGTVRSTDGTVNLATAVWIDEDSAEFSYIDHNCGGPLTLQRNTDSGTIFQQTLSYGNCTGGTITLTPKSNTTIEFYAKGSKSNRIYRSPLYKKTDPRIAKRKANRDKMLGTAEGFWFGTAGPSQSITNVLLFHEGRVFKYNDFIGGPHFRSNDIRHMTKYELRQLVAKASKEPRNQSLWKEVKVEKNTLKVPIGDKYTFPMGIKTYSRGFERYQVLSCGHCYDTLRLPEQYERL